MLGKLLKTIFLPRRARDKLEAHEKAGGRAHAPRRIGPAAGGRGRERILDEAVAIYRKQQREVYAELDEETRRQIEEDATKAFGDALGSKD